MKNQFQSNQNHHAVIKIKMKKLLFIILILGIFFITPAVYAHCPLCTAAVGIGVTTSRFYGLDDTISGLWIGALIASSALWINRLLKKQYIPLQSLVILILSFAVTAIPLYYAKIIAINSMNAVLGIDKLLFGMILGSLLMPAGVFISNLIKKKIGKVAVPFQTILIIITLLVITSLVLFFSLK